MGGTIVRNVYSPFFVHDVYKVSHKQIKKTKNKRPHIEPHFMCYVIYLTFFGIAHTNKKTSVEHFLATKYQNERLIWINTFI